MLDLSKAMSSMSACNIYLIYSFCTEVLFFLSLETPKTAAKRKAEAKKETPPAKKAKAEGEGGNYAELSRFGGADFNSLKRIGDPQCAFFVLRVFTVCREPELQQRL